MAAANQSLHHIGLRYVALASKPTLIWLLVVTGSTSAAVEVGSLMLVASLLSLAMSNEAHLPFYAAFFGGSDRSTRALSRHLAEYLSALVMHITLIIIPAIAICYFFFPTVHPLLVVALALAERTADELLRFMLYRKDWNQWILLLLAKNVIPAIAALTALAFSEPAAGSAYTLGAFVFAFTLLMSKSRLIHKALLAAFQRLTDINALKSYLVSYIRILSIRQIAAIASINVVLLDRYVGIRIWDEADMAYILLSGQVINGIFFALEAKYLSEHRANFINPAIDLSSFWRWRHYVLLMAFCFVSTIVIFFIGTGLGLLPEMQKDLYLAVFLMMVGYAVFYCSIPFNDYLYYRGSATPLALGHVLIVIVYTLLVFGFEPLQTPSSALLLLTIILGLRFLVLRFAQGRIDASRSETGLA